MGFSAPKPDPKIAQQQAAQAAEAKANKIDAIEGQLANEDRIRARLYGGFGRPPAGQAQNVTAGLRSLFAGMYGGGGATLL